MVKSEPKQVYHLDDSFEGLTLGAALKQLVEDSTWGQVKKWISRRHVQINGNLCLDEARRVTPKDVIQLLREPLAKPIESNDVRVAHLDDHLLVVQKPAGITSVRHVAEKQLSHRRRQLQPTLEELLPRVLAKIQRMNWPPVPPKGRRNNRIQGSKRQRFNKIAVANSDFLPPELKVIAVHRLDRDTSGLMLFARNRQTEVGLVGLFRRHKIQRRYIAICHGEIAPQTITSYLVRDVGEGKRGSIPEAEAAERKDALKAVTHIVASEPFTGNDGERYSQIRCELETGRTHQIRIHLSEAGHPLCGETLYASGGPAPGPLTAPRQALHSDSVHFTHPITTEQLSLEMPLPKDLNRWLNRLRKN